MMYADNMCEHQRVSGWTTCTLASVFITGEIVSVTIPEKELVCLSNGCTYPGCHAHAECQMSVSFLMSGISGADWRKTFNQKEGHMKYIFALLVLSFAIIP